MMANQIKKTQLLEPWYSFRLEVPAENIGRAMSDVQRMEGSFDPPETAPDGQTAALTGFAPVAAMRSYPMEVVSYNPGQGTPEPDAGRLPPLPQRSGGHRGGGL